MHNWPLVVNLLLASGLAAVALAVLAALRWLGGVDVQIDISWLKIGGALAGFVVIYECLRRTVFGKPPSVGVRVSQRVPRRG